MSSVLAETLRNAAARPPARMPGEIEICERSRDIEIGVRVEPLDEGPPDRAVVLDLELRIGQRIANVVRELQPSTELFAERHRQRIRDVADHTRHAHSRVRRASRAVVMTALPVGIRG